MKIGRNERCPCNNGKKYKHCHGKFPDVYQEPPPGLIEFAQKKIAETERQRAQQGRGRPIVSTELPDGRRLVLAGERLFVSDKWRFFTDFLLDHLRSVMGDEWGAEQMGKSPSERHIIVQWHDEFKNWQRRQKEVEPGVYSAQPINVAQAYLGLAYNLYLIHHNASLEARLINRLKRMEQFQGAYYELIVINILARNGYKITLENEADDLAKHCELIAVSQDSGRIYSVEAKARAVAGILGKTKFDGATRKDPTGRLTEHLKESFKKPAPHERMIFIDLNTIDPDPSEMPSWINQAVRRLDAAERTSSEKAYVFVTAFGAHLDLLSDKQQTACLAYGFNIPDFSKPGNYRLGEMYRQRQDHSDAYQVVKAIGEYPAIPNTFDGKLMHSSGIEIGETYFFTDLEGGLEATVEEAIVADQDKMMHLIVKARDGRQIITQKPLTDDQFAEYKQHPSTYFGAIRPVQKEHKTPYELFESLMEVHKDYSRSFMIDQMANYEPRSELEKMDDEDVRIKYVDGIVAMMTNQTDNASTVE